MLKRPMSLKCGDQVPIRLRRKESDEVINWLNTQDVISDSIRYLIEKEIAYNGIRNLQEYIPAQRDEEYWEVYKQKEEEVFQELLEQKVEERLQEMFKGKEEDLIKELIARDDIVIKIQHKNKN